MKVIVTGVAGFIGFHLSLKLLSLGFTVKGYDNLSSFYDINLKKERLKILEKKGLNFSTLDINTLENQESSADLFINLAAQPGVRVPIDHHYRYIDSNISGFNSAIYFCKKNKINRLIYASSSSVYDDESQVPFHEHKTKLKPRSFYGVTKLYNEKKAEIESFKTNLKAIGLRFFTVYGPHGRPDMAYYLFSSSILAGKEIFLNNEGEMARDMTYIDDIVEGIIGSIDRIMNNNTSNSHEIFNLGNNTPIKTIHMLNELQKKLKKDAKISFTTSSNESKITHADLTLAKEKLGYNPKIIFEDGIEEFLNWFNKNERNK